MRKRPVKTVLLIEDNAEEARKISAMFNDQGSCSFELAHLECTEDVEGYLATLSVDVILLELELLDSKSFDRLLGAHVARHASIALLCDLKDEATAMHSGFSAACESRQASIPATKAVRKRSMRGMKPLAALIRSGVPGEFCTSECDVSDSKTRLDRRYLPFFRFPATAQLKCAASPPHRCNPNLPASGQEVSLTVRGA